MPTGTLRFDTEMALPGFGSNRGLGYEVFFDGLGHDHNTEDVVKVMERSGLCVKVNVF